MAAAAAGQLPTAAQYHEKQIQTLGVRWAAWRSLVGSAKGMGNAGDAMTLKPSRVAPYRVVEPSP
jgi:hypothetical protein